MSRDRGDYKRPAKAPNVEGMITLKVDNITYRSGKEELEKAFSKYGEVGDVYIPRVMGSSEPRGFAFVRFLNRNDAEEAMRAMDGVELESGRPLRVQEAKNKRPDNPKNIMIQEEEILIETEIDTETETVIAIMTEIVEEEIETEIDLEIVIAIVTYQETEIMIEIETETEIEAETEIGIALEIEIALKTETVLKTEIAQEEETEIEKVKIAIVTFATNNFIEL
eukprot:CAMPEP_0196762110 /NCGR_PEP_ID=MMETSP1095-20130614/1478_1 /TAXON_ID=96789 ORGANISM="Chromulina nebulosa, Strain UTEXLB2642" /NCGR_SAMPLE_ID=MMETSP1095 /ASSEMBLY_ACC=CAM_ASM_000446 /LENGTH=223 /DNA_ID=CAMNT_0042112475 /DNA_START=41 /DNA_END=713 /DNA_ORIENTATION=-